MEVYLAEKRNSDNSALCWFYIISISRVNARNIFIDYMKSNIIEDYLEKNFIDCTIPFKKKLDIWNYALKNGWKLYRLRGITYSGKTKGVKVDLTDTKFIYKA